MTHSTVLKAGIATLAALGFASVGTPSQAQTDLVSFSFDNQSLVADGGLPGKQGVTTITPTGLSNTTPNGVAGIAYATKGASGSASDYYLRAGIGGGGNSSNSNEGGYIQFPISTLGFSGTTVSFYADNSSASSGAFTTETLYYSTNGTNFITTPALQITLPQSFTTAPYTFNIGSIASAIDNDPNAAFRIGFTGSTVYAGTGGPNARVDALTVTGTPLAAAPEPSSLVALALGAGVLGLMAVRRHKVAA